MNTNGMIRAIMVLVTASLLEVCAVAPTVSAALMQPLSVSVTNYPNPFDSRSERTTILFSIPRDAQVRVAIYDLFGNLVRQFPARYESAGTTSVVWDGTNEEREKVAKGGYLVLVTADSETGSVQAIRKIGVLH
jgi:flagellar hook assembly protein FlgD